MNLHRTLGIAVLAACMAAPALRAVDVKDDATKLATLEEQVSFLENALTEALRARDWKQLGLSAQGFKAAGLKDQTLEISILRAERDLAWGGGNIGGMFGGLGGMNRQQWETWGLAARYLSGNTKAIETLRAYASAEIPEMTPIALDEYKKDPIGARKKQGANQDIAQKRSLQENAVLTLALLKEPGMTDKSLALLSSRASSAKKERGGAGGWSGMGGVLGGNGGTDPLVLAALVEDPAKGWKSLSDFAISTDDALDVNYLISVLGALFRLTAPVDDKNPWTQLNAFQVDAEIAKTLPKEAANGNGLGAAFAALANRYQIDPKQSYQFPFSGMLYSLPKGTKDADLIAGLEALKAKITGPNNQYYKSQVDQALAKVRGEEVAARNNPGQQAPVTPPKPNEEF